MHRLLIDPGRGGSWGSEVRVWAKKYALPSALSAKVITEPQFSFRQPPHHSLLANTPQGSGSVTSLYDVLSECNTGMVTVIGLGWQSLATEMREKWSKGLWGHDASCLEADRALPFLLSCGKISTCSLDWLSARCVVRDGLKVTPFCLWLPRAAVPVPGTSTLPCRQCPFAPLCFCNWKSDRRLMIT